MTTVTPSRVRQCAHRREELLREARQRKGFAQRPSGRRVNIERGAGSADREARLEFENTRGGGLAEDCFELGESVLDGIKVGCRLSPCWLGKPRRPRSSPRWRARHTMPEVIRYFEDYAAAFSAPVLTGVGPRRCARLGGLERFPISLHRSLRRRSSWRIPRA